MTARSASQMASISPYEEIYDLIRPELLAVIVNITSLAEEKGSHEGVMAERLEHVLGAPGKRLRPAITLLASRLWRTPSELDVMMGTAVELLHIEQLSVREAANKTGSTVGAFKVRAHRGRVRLREILTGRKP